MGRLSTTECTYLPTFIKPKMQYSWKYTPWQHNPNKSRRYTPVNPCNQKQTLDQ